MGLLDRLATPLRFLAIPHVTTVIIVGQALTYSMELMTQGSTHRLRLVPAKVLEGEWWRLFTFIFEPPAVHAIVIVFLFYFFYLMGSALEEFWGTFKYNFFLFIGYAATIGAAFLYPEKQASNLWLLGSVFFAFAWLAPDFKVQLFFVAPVRIKYFAVITALFFAWELFSGDWPRRAVVLASIANFLLFFAGPIARRIQSGRVKMEQQVAAIASRVKPRHTCAACGITDLADAEAEFRYCTRCAEPTAYCTAHIANHAHSRREA